MISSNTLPEFEDLEKEYEAQILAIKEEQKATPKGKRTSAATVETSAAVDTGESIQVAPEDIEDWVCLPLDMYFARADKKKLSRIERLAWSRNCAKLFNKYAPAFTSKWGEEIGACICLTAIFATRMEPPKIEEPEKKPEPKETKEPEKK